MNFKEEKGVLLEIIAIHIGYGLGSSGDGHFCCDRSVVRECRVGLILKSFERVVLFLLLRVEGQPEIFICNAGRLTQT